VYLNDTIQNTTIHGTKCDSISMLIIIKSSDFLAILKKTLKNIKFGPKLDFHMENILTGQIDHLNFEDEETDHSTRVICTTRSTVA
jgi:hypothetical protein